MIDDEMTLENKHFHVQWRAASGHPSGRWRVCRQFFNPLNPAPGKPRFQEAEGPKGNTRLFKTFEAADKVAKILNEREFTFNKLREEDLSQNVEIIINGKIY